ncbi:hypothetical protein [Haloparvum sedimenti]|uniref:hypothetical protein n=1 Tax=Haloparvum sedimenti TaxID=1678448 RepID=UPI00071E9C89|nr:hypothetical protein [Haloparvum sedimenti]
MSVGGIVSGGYDDTEESVEEATEHAENPLTEEEAAAIPEDERSRFEDAMAGDLDPDWGGDEIGETVDPWTDAAESAGDAAADAITSAVPWWGWALLVLGGAGAATWLFRPAVFNHLKGVEFAVPRPS